MLGGGETGGQVGPVIDIGGVTAREVEAGGEGGEGGGETSGLVDGGALVAIPPLPEGEEGLEGGWGRGK